MSEDSVGVVIRLYEESNNCDNVSKSSEDFIVREIGLDGEVAILTDIVCSELQKKHFPKVEQAARDVSMVSTVDQSIAQTVMERVQSIVKIPLGKEKESELQLFIDNCIVRNEECPLYFLGIPCSDKLMRTAVHKLFKDDPQLSTFIDSDTQTVDGTSFVRLIAKHRRKEMHIPVVQRRRNPWPQELGNFLQFTLLKENIDTMHAVTVLCNVLKLRPSSVGYNGTKDKRGVTTQFCTVYRKKPSDFGRVNSYKLPPFIRVGDFKYVHEPAKLGRLKGNRFELVLRNVTLEDSSVRLACEGLRSSGFINYYGLQRFGRGVTRSHEIGRSMMKSEWRQCIDMLFAMNSTQDQGQEEERPDLTRAKVLYKEGNLAEAMNALPASMSAEKQVLKRLQDNFADPLSAFSALPKNTRLLCAHAYQSYIWNLVASERIRRHGLRLLPGDLVAVSEAAPIVGDGEPPLLEEEDQDDDEADTMVADGDGEIPNEEGKGLSPRQGDDFQSANKKRQGRILQLSADQIQSGVYSIRDVLLPLPGTGVILPANDIGDLYQEILARDGLKMEDYGSVVVAYRMSGAYRRLLQFPESYSWELLRYSDPNEELVSTEVNLFREENSRNRPKRVRDNVEADSVPEDSGGIVTASESGIKTEGDSAPDGAILAAGDINSEKSTSGQCSDLHSGVSTVKIKVGDSSLAESKEQEAPESSNSSSSSSNNRGQSGKYRSLSLKFSLPPGCYATMLLRELTKESTQAQFQAQLTVQSKHNHWKGNAHGYSDDGREDATRVNKRVKIDGSST